MKNTRSYLVKLIFSGILILSLFITSSAFAQENNMSSTKQSYTENYISNKQIEKETHSQGTKDSMVQRNEESSNLDDKREIRFNDNSTSRLNSNLEEPDAGDTIVNTWVDFKKALETSGVNNIFVNSDLTATSIVTVSGKKTVKFNKKTLNIKGENIILNDGNELTVMDLTIGGTTEGTIFSGTGTLILKNSINSSSINLSNIANMTDGSLIFDGANVHFDNNTNSKGAIIAKYFTITNNSNVVSNASKFYQIPRDWDYKLNNAAQININKQSTVVTNSLNKPNTDGKIWDMIANDIGFKIDGAGTSLSIESDAMIQNSGIFYLEGPNSLINISNNSKFKIKGQGTSPILLQSKMGVINVDNNSELSASKESEITDDLYSSVIRFRQEGNMTFNIDNNSKIQIDKKNGKAPAIRMFGGNNKINIAGNSDFLVHNYGDGTIRNGGVDACNQAILYTKDKNNSFNVKGSGSSISLISDAGVVLDSGNTDLSVDIDSDGYFVARGNTATPDKGIFNSALLNFKIATARYFDFRNSNHGNIFSASGNSKFSSTESDISVWKKGTSVTGIASSFWSDVSFNLEGQNLDNLVNTNVLDMEKNWGKTTNYSRISANNQSPIVDQLRVPTNADKSIYAHMAMPEGKYDKPRDAYNNETSMKIDLYNPDGVLTQQFKGVSDTMSIYGEPDSYGWVKATLPNDDFLIENYEIMVSSAWLGSGSESDSKHVSSSNDIKVKEERVFGIVPPAPVGIKNNEIEPTTKNILGTGTPNTKIFLLLNNVDSGITSTVSDDGTFEIELPKTIKVGDKIQILLQDNKGLAKGVINPPITNSSVGNIEPKVKLPFHDTIFPGGTIVNVTGTLTFSELPQMFDFGKQTVSTKEKTYWPDINGNLKVRDTRNNPEGWQVKLSEKSSLNKLGSCYYYSDGKVDNILGENAVVIFKKETSSDGIYDITNDWKKINNKGIKAIFPVDKQIIGEHKVEFKWSLENVPENP